MSGITLGAVYPQTELGGDPRALDLIGRQVEALGFDYLLMYDHVVGAEHADRDGADGGRRQVQEFISLVTDQPSGQTPHAGLDGLTVGQHECGDQYGP